MIDLMPFCAKADDKRARDALRSPFTVHGHTYASDSKALVRVESLPDVPPLSTDDELVKEMEKIALWFQANAGGYYAPLKVRESADIPEVRGKQCTTCQGTGRIIPCVACNGDGEIGCDHCGHTNVCADCEGRGGTSYTLMDGVEEGKHGDVECETCDGWGRYGRIAATVSVRVGEAWFDKAYIDAIAQLSGAEVVVPGPDGGLRAMAFRFKGGEGMVMPMRPPEVTRVTAGAVA